MDIIIQSLGFKASDHLEQYTREHIGKIDNHVHGAIRADVTFFKGPDSDPNNNHCEIRVEVPGNDLFAKKGCPSFEQAVVATVEAIEKIARRNKDKAIGGRHDTE